MRGKLQARLYRLFVYAGALFSMAVLLLIVGYILVKGLPHLTPELFALKYTSDNVSMLPALINTLLMTLLTLLIGVPLGIGAAIYLTEYARRGSRLINTIFSSNYPKGTRMWYNVMGDERWQNHTRYPKVSCWK